MEIENLEEMLAKWTIETPNLEESIMAAVERAETKEQLGDILTELKAMRREMTYLREEVAMIQRERRREREPVYGRDLMPYVRVDDRPLS
jgi:hypothetical protein